MNITFGPCIIGVVNYRCISRRYTERSRDIRRCNDRFTNAPSHPSRSRESGVLFSNRNSLHPRELRRKINSFECLFSTSAAVSSDNLEAGIASRARENDRERGIKKRKEGRKP